jgi:hypothetical protein
MSIRQENRVVIDDTFETDIITFINNMEYYRNLGFKKGDIISGNNVLRTIHLDAQNTVVS